jgi:Xaa-Pro aminopeptidase
MHTPQTFRDRRDRLLAFLQPGVFILPAAHEATRSNDTEYPFRQDSNFHYLTGFPEPDAIAVLRPGHEKPYILFVRPKDREREIWTGIREGVEGAVERYGADEAYPIADWSAKLPELLQNLPRVYFSLGRHKHLESEITGAIATLRTRGRHGIEAPGEVVDSAPLLAEMRLFKSPEEIRCMQMAGDITAFGHLAAMRATLPGMNEYEVQAIVEFEFRKRGGAASPAYGSIVAGGANATILHYVENSRRLVDGDLLLIDAGAEYAGYAGDVTRTFPVGARFTGPQRDVYSVVLRAQLAALDACIPGNTLEAINDIAIRSLTEGLVDLKVLKGSIDELIEAKAHRPYYMHGTGHWLGLDVHDAGAYKTDGQPRKLEAGMVFTVEPGLYFHPDTEAPKEFHGIGVRIEDDVVITKDGHHNLSAGVPKAIDAIEALRGLGN